MMASVAETCRVYVYIYIYIYHSANNANNSDVNCFTVIPGKRGTRQTDMFSNNATYRYEITISKMSKIILVVRTPHTNPIDM